MKKTSHTRDHKVFKLSLIASVCLTAIGTAHAQQATGTDTSTAATTATGTASTATAPAAKSSNIGTVKITGAGQIGNGLMVQEDAVKARSTVTRGEIEKERSTGNAYQSMDLLPGVNTYSYDATGLFGGGLSIRGFDASQIGIAINGVPINDSGSYAVYPSEYLDQNNLCTQTVAQGATDLDSPHIGATGGNISLVTCDPEDKRRFRVSQTVGGLGLSNTFVRADTGLFLDNRAKAYISYSYATADKWKGDGNAKRNHIDAGFHFDLGQGNYISGAVMYNRMNNNNIYDPSLAELNKYGYYYDYATTFKSGGKYATTYYQLSTNPFESLTASMTGMFRLSDDTTLKVQPYLWYGNGTGGNQQNITSSSLVLYGPNGMLKSGTTFASSSVTRTERPGVTFTLAHNWENHSFTGGLWLERASQTQTGPAVPVNDDGSTTDYWLSQGWLLNKDGTPYQSRDYHTITTSWQLFGSDSVSLLGDRLNITGGFRAPFVRRDFSNIANSSFSPTSLGGTNYEVSKSYFEFLPQLGIRYYITNDQQVYFNAARNFRAPPNWAYQPSDGNVELLNGKVQTVGSVKPETSTVVDLGYRYQNTLGNVSGTVFFVDYQNRQANVYDPNSGLSSYTNAGRVRNYGFELEAGSRVINGWSIYASLTHNHSWQLDNLRTGVSTTLNTAGKAYPLDPDWLFGTSVQYERNSWYARLKGKLTGSAYATLTNDERVPAYMTFDFDAGYRLPNTRFIKNPTLRLNVSNIFNRQYRNAASLQTSASQSTVYYYLGAPRLISATFSADF